MPVTFTVASHSAVPHKGEPEQLPSVAASLRRVASEASSSLSEVLESSLTPSDLSQLIESRNGFVYTCMRAYNTHHHLVLRPDDVWIAILCQFSSYVEANAEAMRGYFVNHEGKKELVVQKSGTRHSVGWGQVAEEFGELLEKNVKDPELREWIVPGFSTTTETDRIVGSVIMMATLKKYFSYTCCFLCGIPSVTLLGTREDWCSVQQRVQRLRAFGAADKHPHLHEWCSLLTPLLENFTDAFTAFSPTTPNPQRQGEIRDFFSRICHRESFGSGSSYISGWLMSFCAFDEKGKWQLQQPQDSLRRGPTAFGDAGWIPRVDSSNIPNAYVEVDVKIDDNGVVFDSVMIAGLAGYKVLGEQKDTVQPHAAWWIFTKEERAEENEVGFGVGGRWR